MEESYDNDGFNRRLQFAASFISLGRPTTRTFDSCFENFDGDVIALALYLRSLKRPDTQMARNLWKYIGTKEQIIALADKYPARTKHELNKLSETFMPRNQKPAAASDQ
jgi:hypothetical protein